jgi:chromate reductase
VRVLGVCGSLQARSSTASVLATVAERLPSGTDYERFTELGGLPHFNPDLDVDPVPTTVHRWRQALAAADAVVLATPEYAHSFPGALKDALDWIVGSGELVGTPILLVTASAGGGVRAGDALAPVLEVLTATVVGPVGIWGVSPKVSSGRLTDPDDLAALDTAVGRMIDLVRTPREA